jgi:hypothetical protein
MLISADGIILIDSNIPRLDYTSLINLLSVLHILDAASGSTLFNKFLKADYEFTIKSDGTISSVIKLDQIVNAISANGTSTFPLYITINAIYE